MVVNQENEQAKRSYNMSRIRSTNTKIEVLVRHWLFAHGYRYRINDKRYPGKPDIVLPKYRTVIFVHGCFWHYHGNCPIARMPNTNVSYWEHKLLSNRERDDRNIKALELMGWKVIVVWECELKADPDTRLINLLCEIQGKDLIDV
jgi:DNA mismatch endonuclease Vsr